MDVYDLVIVGAGPAALTAAIYATRDGLKTLVVEKAVIGGLMATVDRVDNYPGFSDGVAGMVLAQDFEAQARRFGAEIDFGEVTGIESDGKTITVNIDSGDVHTRACLIAAGATYRKLNIPGERKYYAKGVHYCATCDGPFYRDKEIVVIGGANTAVQEAVYLTKFARHISLLVRSYVKADDVIKKALDEKIATGAITLLEGWSPNEITGDGKLVNGVDIFDSKDENHKKHLNSDGVFIFAGTTPNTDFLQNSAIKMDDGGCIVVDDKLRTNVAGVYACGDVRTGATKQIISAAGDGATAAINIRKYLKGME